MDLQQIFILIIGLSIAGGFAFGGIAQFSGITGGGGSNNQQQEFNATLPSQNYMESSYSLSAREQRVLAVQNDIVFVNSFYSNQSQFEDMKQLESVPQDFGNRVYVNLVNSSSTNDVLYNYGITEFPKAVVIGGSRQGVTTVSNVSTSTISSSACKVFATLGDQAANCL
ncbi:MAG: hypothetical protein H8Z69_02020 [Nanohaloarchaea archaeon]|nr:hypothetical protein [Candidatus Nanohaloarchaea archaeon]